MKMDRMIFINKMKDIVDMINRISKNVTHC